MIRARHDPYSFIDRFPQGACAAGSVVCLRVNCPDAPQNVYVRLWRGVDEEWLPMRPVSGGMYEAHVSVGTNAGLLWYYFVIDLCGGERFYLGKPIGGACALYDHEPPSFQITVYSAAFTSPEWMRESVMMQIMPDRFYIGSRGKVPPHGRGAYLHESWYEPPDLCRNGDDEEAVDFFGGTLNGIREKLPFLKDMGVRAVYLTPIFRARSNHKYDTADYMQIDPSFGTEEDLKGLCADAAAESMHVVLDGVFSHTGADSRYFNKYGTYRTKGAYNKYGESPYSPWYRFLDGRDDYDSWWGIHTLPKLNQTEPSFMEFAVTGRDSVISHYLRCGVSGWRLDVADELPMEFIRAVRARVKQENPDACVIGEVWEDVTNKIAYGRQRCYATGDTLDSAMNYPLRENVINFLLGRENARVFEEFLNYQHSTLPRPMLYSMMNLLGSHDKPRIINVLAGQQNLEPPREHRRFIPLSRSDYERGKARFIQAFALVCSLPGMPMLYYGDDAGLTGMGDPFCRGTYPWGRGDSELHSEIKRLICERNASKALKQGETLIRALNDDTIEIRRTFAEEEKVYRLRREG
ncbi:MAG: glycoside hydrolase family 13 protein [Clostridia bacterium]|nr:glycoside hydrolase family 13 protein [Clostridia bacterium]